ncbi:Hypothetical protein NTJ_02343 [Nesidiocoris tenuis]|uniref:Uncharacterized protein n=1 Tax=Nesidiocoris tenuis TaxID=355587 RepID=A0ABN7AF77_9HEMI|nr:Hypothetical protein NTJ_02343 [Nesidiocoris tenuis]
MASNVRAAYDRVHVFGRFEVPQMTRRWLSRRAPVLDWRLLAACARRWRGSRPPQEKRPPSSQDPPPPAGDPPSGIRSSQ